MTYHLSRNGQPTGTCSKDEAIARYARGEILPTDLVWCEGMANWAAASQVFGAQAAPTPQPVSPSPAPVAPAPAPTPVPPAYRPANDAGKPSNNLVWAILATLFCCLPSGIVAIVYAAQVDTKWNQGDYAGAQAAAKNAATWSWVSLGVGLLANLGFGIFYVIMMSQAAAMGGY